MCGSYGPLQGGICPKKFLRGGDPPPIPPTVGNPKYYGLIVMVFFIALPTIREFFF